MDEVGLRDMRQNASELVRRAEAGESMIITVSGRPAAVLGPATHRTWRQWTEVADAFDHAEDPSWESDMDQLDGAPTDPWAQR